jgi:small subunit ribosomal protein S13
MPRILGVDVPGRRPTYIALTYLYGIGRTTAIEVCRRLDIDMQKKADDLSEEWVRLYNEGKVARTNIHAGRI